MATPFTAEEQLVRRSLFGSLFNVAANKLHKSTPTTQHTAQTRVVQENFDQCQQPCSSSSLYSTIPTPNDYQHHFRVYVDPETYFQNNPTINSPVSSPSIGQGSPASVLGHQLDRLEIDFNGGFLQNEQQIQNTPHTNNLKHQEEIYREIVSECRAFEQQQQPNDRGETEMRLINDASCDIDEECQIVNAALNSAILSPQIEPTSQLNYFQEPQQQLLLLPSNSPLQINENSNNNNVVGLSLEHLVKVLVETVREVTGTRNITSNKNEREGNEEVITRDETAAQILERRRKQNNAAAARYRRRQRKVENTMQQELALLERRNYELRTSIANLRAEIEAENSLLKAIQSGKNK